MPAGSRPPTAVSVCISTDERHSFGALAPRRPGGHRREGEPEVWLLCRSWSNSSGRHRHLSQNIYPHASLDLLQRPPHVFRGTLVIGLITEPLGFVQDAQDVMVLFDEWLAVLELCL